MSRGRIRVLGVLGTTITVSLLAVSAIAQQMIGGPMAFVPIPGSAYGQLTDAWTVPFVIPEGFSQFKVSDETDLDIYPGESDLDDMNTVNENGPEAGRYLYRTHEVDDLGAVSVVDLYGERAPQVLVQEGNPAFPELVSATDLDGIRWTPWQTVLFAEEELEEPVVGTQDFGHLYEIILDPNDLMRAVEVRDRPEVGRMRHEGIEVGPDSSVYVVDELNGGSIFRFVPDRRGDLSSGQLYALQIIGLNDAQQLWDSGNQHVGRFRWVALDQAMVSINANAAADAVHATEYGRPEDMELINNVLYVANTTEDRVIAIDLQKRVVSAFVQAGRNVRIEDTEAEVTGFNQPDNLAEGPDGRLWIVEDNVPSDIWVADFDTNRNGAADGVHLFASMVDSAAEGTGIYFGKDPHILFVNLQHAAKPLADGTWMITNR